MHLDLELDRAAAGENERHHAGRRVGRLEADGEQFEDGIGPVAVDVARCARPCTRSKVSAARRRS